MKLVIVESPSKAKTIKKYLGANYKVLSSVGHICDLPKNNEKAIDIEAGFIPHYEIIKGKENIIEELKKMARRSQEIILATDPDREGEAIAWHIARVLSETKNSKNSKTQFANRNQQTSSKFKRIVFHEITKEAILKALEHPRSIDQNLRRAQEARRVLDRLFGYDLSALIWKKVRYGLSAGRVQSPALRIIVEREREIKAFKPEKFWKITANVKTANKEEFNLVCSQEPRDKKEVDKILKAGEKEKWIVAEFTKKETNYAPRPPFTTSTLQQAASSRLGMSPSQTMAHAQKLYEAGFITYMRTDSVALSNLARKQISHFITKEFGEKFSSPRIYKTKSKSAQEAHEAIRPTNVSMENAGETAEQKKLYQLIWRRAVASQMANAKILKSKIKARIGDTGLPLFYANGSRVLFEGWLKIDPLSRGEDIELPAVKPNEVLELIKISSQEKETLPPPRYSEAGLIKELEKRGIGRPSTYATIIKTLKDREYAIKKDRALIPTEIGEIVSSFLEKNFTNYISDAFTAEMENELDQIANGQREYEKTLKDFYDPFSRDIRSKEKIPKITTLGEAPKKFKCPICGSPMVIKLGKTGKFLSCSKFPECDGALTMEGKKLEGPKEIGEKCPKCGSALVEKQGRYGKFVACSNFPKCRYIKKDASNQNQNSTGVQCPKCQKGEMIEKRGKFGIFYACSNYPQCHYAIKAKPTGKKCPLCGELMMEGTKTIPERCSNKNCPNHRPDKLKK